MKRNATTVLARTAQPRGVSRRRAILGIGAIAQALVSAPAWSQSNFPNRPIRLVVTLPAGTSADAMARFVAERAGRALGQPIVVDNRPGASSIIGTQMVASAAPDGYTLLYGVAPSMSLNPHLFKKLAYKPADFAPIAHLLNVPFVLVVRADTPYRSLADLLQAAKNKTGAMNYASYGEGSPNHVALLQILQNSGARMTHIPYKDGGLMDVVGGAVDCSLEVTAMAMPHILSHKLRPLAVSSQTRLDKLPDVPTLTELGAGAPLYSWNGVFAPAGTPSEVLHRLSRTMEEITASSEFRQKVLDFTQVPVHTSAQAFAQFLAEDSQAWGRVIQQGNIRLDQ